MSFSEDGQTAIRELCDALEEAFSTLTQMTDGTDSDDLRPAPSIPHKKSLEFTRAVLKHSSTPSRITDLVEGLRDMRSDVETCFTKLETYLQRVDHLYDIMNHGLERRASRTSILSTSTNITARRASRTSILSTSTNLEVRSRLAAWLKGWEGAWRPLRQRESTSVSRRVSSHTPFHLIIDFSFVTFQPRSLPKGHPTHFGPIQPVSWRRGPHFCRLEERRRFPQHGR